MREEHPSCPYTIFKDFGDCERLQYLTMQVPLNTGTILLKYEGTLSPP